MSAIPPSISRAKLPDSRASPHSSRDPVLRLVATLRIGIARLVEHQIDFGKAETGAFDIELQVDKPLQLDHQQVPVPACVERELVVGENVGALFCGCQVRKHSVGTVPRPIRRAASTRPWPARIS